MAVNKAIILGNVGQNPEIKQVGDNKVANFTIATTERGYTTQAGTVIPDKTEWHNVVAWRGLAEICERFIQKGSQIYIEGKITTRTWEKDSVKMYKTEIVADNIQLLGKKPESNQQSQPEAYDPYVNPATGLPF